MTPVLVVVTAVKEATQAQEVTAAPGGMVAQGMRCRIAAETAAKVPLAAPEVLVVRGVVMAVTAARLELAERVVPGVMAAQAAMSPKHRSTAMAAMVETRAMAATAGPGALPVPGAVMVVLAATPAPAAWQVWATRLRRSATVVTQAPPAMGEMAVPAVSGPASPAMEAAVAPVGRAVPAMLEEVAAASTAEDLAAAEVMAVLAVRVEMPPVTVTVAMVEQAAAADWEAAAPRAAH